MASLLSACGLIFQSQHETPLAYLELYPGAQAQYQARILYRVNSVGSPHNPLDIVKREYTNSTWVSFQGDVPTLIAVGKESSCPEGIRNFASKYPVRGSLVIVGTEALISLESVSEVAPDGSITWGPHRLNGKYRIERPAATPETVVMADDSMRHYCMPGK